MNSSKTEVNHQDIFKKSSKIGESLNSRQKKSVKESSKKRKKRVRLKRDTEIDEKLKPKNIENNKKATEKADEYEVKRKQEESLEKVEKVIEDKEIQF